MNYDIPTVIRRRQMHAVALPPARQGLLDPNWQYTPAAETDILATFKRMGWVPPTEARRRQALLNPNG